MGIICKCCFPSKGLDKSGKVEAIFRPNRWTIVANVRYFPFTGTAKSGVHRLFYVHAMWPALWMFGWFRVKKFRLWLVLGFWLALAFSFSALMLLVGGRKGIQPAKTEWWNTGIVILSGVRCKWFAYGPADATATPSSIAPVISWMVYLSGAGLGAYPGCPGKRPLNGCSSSNSSSSSSIYGWALEFVNRKH